jgi:DNA (cytosine-5)-methyltransferase 1
MLKFGSVCSGIGVPEKVAQDLGWKLQFSSEIESIPSKILDKHFPSVPNLGDMTKIDGTTLDIDLLCGGTPCQDFSTDGTQKGLKGSRSVLALDFIRIARESRATWVIWENVLGSYSTNSGQDLRTFINELTQVGYCVGWRVLDARYFGHPMRRPRIFLVGYLGDWRPSKWVLFEQGSHNKPIKTLDKQHVAHGDLSKTIRVSSNPFVNPSIDEIAIGSSPRKTASVAIEMASVIQCTSPP